MAKDPYKDSPYDEHGMPLGAEYVDYDNKGDVAKATVKDKPITDFDLNPQTQEYDEPKIKRTEPNPADFNSAIEVKGHKHPSREDHIGIGIPELTDNPDKLDMDDPKTHEKLAEEDPKETNKTKLESDKVDHDKKDDSDPDSDFEKALKNV